jgi:uncharacterized protein
MKLTPAELIKATEEYVKNELNGAEGGHDWWHIERVRKLALAIAESEPVDSLIVELGALLHDIADSKFHDGDETLGAQKARQFLLGLSVDENIISHIESIINHISFKGGNNEIVFTSDELEVVQDADRLDAMGAMGIARAFNYGGFKGRELYNPSIPPQTGMNREQYKNSNSPTLNHFYEKLLLRKDRMNTKTGRKIADKRHAFMEIYLNQFYREWEGKD